MPVFKRNNLIYLQVDSHMYCYDESSVPMGEGAMGIVYKGKEVHNGTIVAIKRVKDQYTSIPEIRRRAHQEANLMFSHPNLVEMLGCCEVQPDQGPLFIISKYINGKTMDRFVNEHIRSLPNVEKRICNMFIPVLDALSYIHQKSIIHLDIKPTNIMVENGNNCRLMDLGIVETPAQMHKVMSGMMGTPKYAAPEQFANNHSQISFATDIYEAGVTLYELITQKNPFVGKTIMDVRELHQSIVLQKTPAISEAILVVLQKATAIDPKDRYQTASEMKTAIKNALSNSQPPTPKWPYQAIALGALLLIVLIIIAFMILYIHL